MSIIYSLIARSDPTQPITLCSYDMAHGNYPPIVQQILKNTKITESKIFKYNNEQLLQIFHRYNFHILKDQELLFVCMAAVNMKNKTAFVFLQELRKKFRERYPAEDIRVAKDYDMSASFSDTYKSLITLYNTTTQTDNKDLLQKQLSTLLPIMSQNIQKVLQNEQKVSLVVKKTQKVHSIADEIKKNASMMKKDAFCKRNIWKIFGVVVVVAVVVVLVFLL